MKLLLTSNGLSNQSIVDAFVELVGKPAKEIRVCFIITASIAEPGHKDWLVKDLYRIYEQVGYIDILDVAEMNESEWRPRIEPADVIFVGGGNTFHLSYGMQKSSLFAALPRLLESKVYAGISAGSIIAGQSIGIASGALKNPESFADKDYDLLGPKGKSAGDALKFVDFLFRPHLNSGHFKLVTKDFMQQKANEMNQTIYALDDSSAIVIDGDNLQVVSEGEWLKLEPNQTFPE